MDALKTSNNLYQLINGSTKGDEEQDEETFDDDIYNFVLTPEIQDSLNTMIISSSSNNRNNESLLMDYLHTKYDIIKLNPNIDYESDKSSQRSRCSSIGSVIFENDDMELEQPVTGLVGYDLSGTDDSSTDSSSSSSSSSSSTDSEDEDVPKVQKVNTNSNEAKRLIEKISYDDEIPCNVPAPIIFDTPVVEEASMKVLEQSSVQNMPLKLDIGPIELVKEEEVLTKLLSGNVKKSSSKVYSSPGELTVDSTCDTRVVSDPPPEKKKRLNLQEYKKRRIQGGIQIPHDNSASQSKRCQLELDMANMPTSLPDIPLPYLDGSINPLMIKKEEPVQLSPRNNPDYEKLVCLSISCNTDVTICPGLWQSGDENRTEQSLNTIVSTLREKGDNQNILKSQNSLFSSIQHVVTQSNQKSTIVTSTPECSTNAGEDKIIRFIHKDDVPPECKEKCTQTDEFNNFPPLELLPCSSEQNHSTRNYRKRRSDSHERSQSMSPNRPLAPKQRKASNTFSLNRNKSLSSAASSPSESDASRTRNKRSHSRSTSRSSTSSSSSVSSYHGHRKNDDYDRSRSRTRCPSENDRLRSRYSNENNHGRQDRSRGKFRERSRERAASPKRRTVYIGDMELSIVKEDVQRILTRLGIKFEKIVIHQKTDLVTKQPESKFAFITFKKPSIAYDALDSISKDPSVSNYRVCFGNRRAFCINTYADLDNTSQNYHVSSVQTSARNNSSVPSFEELLLDTKEILTSTKKSRLS